MKTPGYLLSYGYSTYSGGRHVLEIGKSKYVGHHQLSLLLFAFAGLHDTVVRCSTGCLKTCPDNADVRTILTTGSMVRVFASLEVS